MVNRTSEVTHTFSKGHEYKGQLCFFVFVLIITNLDNFLILIELFFLYYNYVCVV